MTRPPRQLRHSPLLHVWSRGADRQDIFLDDHDRAAFVDALESAVEQHDIAVHAYALMSNHHHLIVETLDGTAAPVSAAMRRIGLETARRHNTRYERSGPLFENRFGSKEITNDRQLQIVGRYVHRNPIVMPGRLESYRFSSLPVYIGDLARPKWLTTERIIGAHGGSHDDYRRFVLRCLPGEPNDASGPWPWGVTELSVIDEAIDRHLPGASPNARRALAAELAIGHRVAPAADVARHHGFSSPAAARSAARRARSRRSADARHHDVATRVERELGWSDDGLTGDAA